MARPKSLLKKSGAQRQREYAQRIKAEQLNTLEILRDIFTRDSGWHRSSVAAKLRRCRDSPGGIPSNAVISVDVSVDTYLRAHELLGLDPFADD